MATKIYTEKLYGYSNQLERTKGFLTWIHNCFIDAGFTVPRSSLAAAVSNADNWTGGTIRTPVATLTTGNWAIFEYPVTGVNEIIFGVYNSNNYEASCFVSNKIGFDLAAGTATTLPDCTGAVEDKICISRHVVGDTYSKIVFANDTTTNYKLYLIIDAPNSFVCIIRNLGTGVIVSVFGSLQLTDTTDVNYPFVNVGSLNSAASSAHASQSIGSSVTAGNCQMALLSSPATKVGGSFITYEPLRGGVSATSPWSETTYKLPYNIFSLEFIEEEILVASITPEFFLRGKLPLIRWVQAAVPDGTISAGKTRAVIGNLSYPWEDSATVTMW